MEICPPINNVLLVDWILAGVSVETRPKYCFSNWSRVLIDAITDLIWYCKLCPSFSYTLLLQYFYFMYRFIYFVRYIDLCSLRHMDHTSKRFVLLITDVKSPLCRSTMPASVSVVFRASVCPGSGSVLLFSFPILSIVVRLHLDVTLSYKIYRIFSNHNIPVLVMLLLNLPCNSKRVIWRSWQWKYAWSCLETGQTTISLVGACWKRN